MIVVRVGKPVALAMAGAVVAGVVLAGCTTEPVPAGRHMMDRDGRPSVVKVQQGPMMRAWCHQRYYR